MSTDDEAPVPAKKRRMKKQVIRAVLGSALIVSALFLIVSVAGVMSSLTRSDEQVEIFNEAASLSPDLLGSIVWAPDATDLPREMEPLTRIDITASWIRAWDQLTIVSQTGDVSGVEVYFSNSARRGVLARAENWGDVSIHQLGHELELTFYSEDGQIASIRSNETKLQHRDTSGELTLVRETVETYETVMVLEDGNWRIHHWVRRSVEAGEWVSVTADALAN